VHNMKGYTFAFVALTALFAVANAKCDRFVVDVTDSNQLVTVLQTAKAGEDIVLAKGEYRVDWNKDFVLNATGKKDCPIRIFCKNPGDALIRSAFNLTASSYVEVSNLSFNAGNDTTRVAVETRGKHVTFDHLQIYDAGFEGIALKNAEHITVHNCTFDNCHQSLVVVGTSNSDIELCTFLETDYVVLVVRDSNSNVFNDNAFYGRYEVASSSFVRMEENNHYNVFTHNSFVSTYRRMPKGIQADESNSHNVYKENFLVVVGVAFADTNNDQVCASNKVVGGGIITNGAVDMSC